MAAMLVLSDPLPMALPGTGVPEKPRNIFGVGQAPEFKIGDRVKITEIPAHDPYHQNAGATVVKIHPGPAYGLIIDGMEYMGTHKWYVGNELGQGPESRTIGKVILIPDIIMAALGLAGTAGSFFIKHRTASMVVLMTGSMALAVALHNVIMRLTEGQLQFELNCPPAK